MTSFRARFILRDIGIIYLAERCRRRDTMDDAFLISLHRVARYRCPLTLFSRAAIVAIFIYELGFDTAAITGRYHGYLIHAQCRNNYGEGAEFSLYLFYLSLHAHAVYFRADVRDYSLYSYQSFDRDRYFCFRQYHNFCGDIYESISPRFYRRTPR